MNKGIVIKSTGSWYTIQVEGKVVEARIAGKLRTKDRLKLTNPIAVGDEVKYREDNEDIIIEDVLDRKNYVLRQSPRKKHAMHLIAANVDQAILVTTIREPNLKQGFIDRFLLTTEPFNIPVVIIFNKKDVYTEEDLAIYDYLKTLYEGIGYKVLLTSAETTEGIEELKQLTQDKTSLLSGQSGVGKSSILNQLVPGIETKVDEISNYTGKGQHTTTFAEMFDLPYGGKIIDSPGIKTLSFNYLEPLDVAHNFKEFFKIADQCKFGARCLHINEPSCAVKSAIEEESISMLRYENYLAIMADIQQQKSWERHKNF